MKRVKALIITGAALVAVSAVATACDERTPEESFKLPDNAIIYDTEDLTRDILISRTPEHTIVERCVGKVLDDDGNGKMINDDSYYNYINYSCVRDAQPGDLIVTYFIYDADGHDVDDITDRYDMIVARDEIGG